MRYISMMHAHTKRELQNYFLVPSLLDIEGCYHYKPSTNIQLNQSVKIVIREKQAVSEVDRTANIRQLRQRVA